MKWVIDRIEDDIVILESISTKEKKEVSINLLPSSIHEGSVLVFYNEQYINDEDYEIKRRTEILERFKRLRNNRD